MPIVENDVQSESSKLLTPEEGCGKNYNLKIPKKVRIVAGTNAPPCKFDLLQFLRKKQMKFQ